MHARTQAHYQKCTVANKIAKETLKIGVRAEKMLRRRATFSGRGRLSKLRHANRPVAAPPAQEQLGRSAFVTHAGTRWPAQVCSLWQPLRQQTWNPLEHRAPGLTCVARHVPTLNFMQMGLLSPYLMVQLSGTVMRPLPVPFGAAGILLGGTGFLDAAAERFRFRDRLELAPILQV